MGERGGYRPRGIRTRSIPPAYPSQRTDHTGPIKTSLSPLERGSGVAINWYSGYWLYAKSFFAGGPIKLGYVRGRTGLTPSQAGKIRRADEPRGERMGVFRPGAGG